MVNLTLVCAYKGKSYHCVSWVASPYVCVHTALSGSHRACWHGKHSALLCTSRHFGKPGTEHHALMPCTHVVLPYTMCNAYSRWPALHSLASTALACSAEHTVQLCTIVCVCVCVGVCVCVCVLGNHSTYENAAL